MLTVNQPRFFSRNLVVYDGSTPVAEIRYGTLGSAATIAIGGMQYQAARTGWFASAYQLFRGDFVVASATAAGFWSRRYELQIGTSTCVLRRISGWTATGWRLTDGDLEVGSVQRHGFFRSETVADFSPSVDLTVQVFVIWLANVLWQQDQSAAAAG